MTLMINDVLLLLVTGVIVEHRVAFEVFDYNRRCRRRGSACQEGTRAPHPPKKRKTIFYLPVFIKISVFRANIMQNSGILLNFRADIM